MPYRKSLVQCDVTVGTGPGQTTIHLGIADVFSGGEGDSDTATYARASGTINLGGTKTRGAATCTFLCDEAFWVNWKTLDRQRGEYDAVLSVVPTGDDGTPFASGPASFTGKLKTVPVPEGDFGSNEGATVALVFDLDADAA